ncbi:hypothetical protein LJB42_001062 [Komagataella kurtzmanii]|nr:hypothetical protein LJB42_001062 [Komagataella kurtzmanii]
MILQLLSYVGIVSGFVSITLAIASGLYYLSELVEEYTEFTRRLIGRLIIAIVGVFLLLLFLDGFPIKLSIFSLLTYYIYYKNLKTFPFIDLTGPVFVSSCILAVLNHYLWFQHFSNPYIPTIEERISPNYIPPHIPTFAEIASFFGICIWLVPFTLFISLSASENTLPSTLNDINRFDKKNDDTTRQRGVGLVKLVIGFAYETIYNFGRLLGYEWDPNQGRII